MDFFELTRLSFEYTFKNALQKPTYDKNLDNMIVYTCRNDYHECIKHLIITYPYTYVQILSRTLDNPYNALHIACCFNARNVASVLVNTGMDVNKVCELGYAPLHYAVIMGHIDIVRLLVDVGASVDCKIYGKTIKDLAFDYNHLELIKYIGTLSLLNVTTIKDAIIFNNLKFVSLQVEKHKYDVNALIDGVSTLDFAITYDKCHIVSYLIAVGASLTRTSKNTSLILACSNSCPKCVEQVLKAGVSEKVIEDAVVWNDVGRKQHRETCIILLHKYGFNIDTCKENPLLKRILRNDMGKLLRYAIGMRLVDVTGKQLIKDGNKEYSILRYAYLKCTQKAIKTLFVHGVDCSEFVTTGPLNKPVLAIKNSMVSKRDQTLDEMFMMGC